MKTKTKFIILIYGCFLLVMLLLYVGVNIELHKRGNWMNSVNIRLGNLENGR